MPEVHLTTDELGWLVAACDFTQLAQRLAKVPNYKMHSAQARLAGIKAKLIVVQNDAADGYTIAVRVPRGPCGMRNHAADCDCQGMGGDR